MRVIGHRGCPDRGPENTIVAFQRAAPHVDWIEFDVRRCGTGELVVFHDRTLDRLCGVSAPLEAVDLERLRSYPVAGSTEHVPTVSEALAAIPPGVGVNIELKERGTAADVAVACGDVENAIVVSSFEPAIIREWVAVADEPTAYVSMDPDAPVVETAVELGCEFVHPQYDLVLADPSFVPAAHEDGLEVNAWTLRSADAYRRLEEAGVDGVIVDDWAVVD